MKFKKIFLLLLCGISFARSYGQTSNITAGDSANSCSGICGCAGDTQAPLGIMTDHIHSKGKWMVTYTYVNTMMNGNNIGTTKASDNTVYKNYMMAPETMTMQMHMVMAMYGVTDRLTLMAMGGFMLTDMSMNMSSMMHMPGMTMGDMTMLSSSSGFSDTRLSALYNFSGSATRRIIGSLGIGLPTGTIKATGTTMLGDNQRLPYDMQTGTGSVSIAPGITYAFKYRKLYWGADAGADVKMNYNSLGYKFGNLYHASAWAGYSFLPFLSGTLRAEGVYTGKISGSDPASAIPVYETNDPTANTANYGGQVGNVYAGLNFYSMKRVLEHFRVMVEYGIPVYQNLNGTQMALKSNILAGLQYSF